MIKTAIIEDEEKAYETLKEYLLSFGKENQIDFSITHYSEGLSFLEECTGFDLVFMDIEFDIFRMFFVKISNYPFFI